ncbi:hypothetical protein [Emcibacter sp.]|uniref:hypothetical protein n=1 Tax=Emcibacter sp. TaxID=1979954 RepID=UPI002AA624EC|nr:hypothetical protein [Emcibacter sp.]
MSTSCPACGARLTRNTGSDSACCGFCGYERLCSPGSFSAPSPYDRSRCDKSILQLHRYCSGTNIRSENAFTIPLEEETYSPGQRDLDGIASLYVPLFTDDLNDYFRERYLSLKTGGMLMIVCPVKSRFHRPAPLPGQKHIFGRRTLFYLMERHGFKLHWKDRFRRNPLTLIAKKM